MRLLPCITLPACCVVVATEHLARAPGGRVRQFEDQHKPGEPGDGQRCYDRQSGKGGIPTNMFMIFP